MKILTIAAVCLITLFLAFCISWTAFAVIAAAWVVVAFIWALDDMFGVF